jgi:signal peptidase I
MGALERQGDSEWGSWDAYGGPRTWVTLGTGELPRPLEPGRIANLSFWHYDQRLELWADDQLIARGEYNWSPLQRLEFAVEVGLEQILDAGRQGAINPLSWPAHYRGPEVRWEFLGGPFVAHRVGLKRDVHYQSPMRMAGEMARATHPFNAVTLGPDHFFVCGDNSPASSDSRLWEAPDPWVALQIDDTEGIVPRDLMIGRAFFVYFPSLLRTWFNLPMPDFGRLRWIW